MCRCHIYFIRERNQAGYPSVYDWTETTHINCMNHGFLSGLAISHCDVNLCLFLFYFRCCCAINIKSVAKPSELVGVREFRVSSPH